MSEVAWWQGEHGDEYTERNADADINIRVPLWKDILDCFDSEPLSVLEIGAGSGKNLKALLRAACVPAKMYPGGKVNFSRPVPLAIEPNEKARAILREVGFDAFDGTAANPGQTADLVFTSGVLIHIPPDELLAACQGIYDAAERYVVCIEYFSADPETKPYRGRHLWKRDFGDFWMENFPLTPLGCGFAWKRMTGLNNLTWWAFSK